MLLPTPVRYYHTPMAPNPRRVQIFMAEKGIEIETVNISIMDGEHKKPEYLAKTGGSPQVPALELADGTVLVESPTICRYLESIWPEPNLMGRGDHEKALIDMWSRRIEIRLMMTIAQSFRHTHPRMAELEDQVPEWGRVNADRIDGRLAELNTQLEGREWVCCDRFTNADITGLIGVGFLRLIKRSIPEEMTALQAWYDRVSARPSAQLK